MFVDMQEYVAEGGELLVGKVRKFRKNSAETVREAVTGSAETLKALKSPVRLLARSNQVRTPRESIVGEAPEESESLFLGGSPEAFAGPSSAMSSEAIPQRILSAMRE